MVSRLEETFALHLRAEKIEGFLREFRFAADVVGTGPGLRQRLKNAGLKDWRFDFADPARKIAVEIEGGNWSGGRHTRGKGFEEDCIKYGEAMKLGWTVYRCTGGMVKSGEAIDTLKQLMAIKTPA